MEKLAVGRAVVVACIVVAVAALVVAPIEAVTRPSTRQICQDNLRLISRALTAYLQDYGVYPPIDNGAVPLRSWCDSILPYGVSKMNLLCPAQDMRREKWARSIWSWANSPYTYGYAINAQLCLDNPLLGIQPVAPLNRDRLLLVADGFWSWFAYDDSTATKETDPYSPNWWSNKICWRHPRPSPYGATNGGANFLTAGGQVVYVKKYVNKKQYQFSPNGISPVQSGGGEVPADPAMEVVGP